MQMRTCDERVEVGLGEKGGGCWKAISGIWGKGDTWKRSTHPIEAAASVDSRDS